MFENLVGFEKRGNYKGWEKVVMVCQAAGQTKFRALKHENGIAGGATIIVRVIACFQPLQDCQVSSNLYYLLFLATIVNNSYLSSNW